MINFPRSEAMTEEAFAAAPEASDTLSGMSFGAPKAPPTNIPGREVSSGENKISVEQKSY